MSVRKLARIYQWGERCPHRHCSNLNVTFVELTVECIDSKTGRRLKMMEVLYDHPLKVHVHNNYHEFEFVHSEDYRKHYPGIKCQQCGKTIEDYLVHERFVSRYHDGNSWKEADLEVSKMLEFALPTRFVDKFDCD